LRPRRRTLPRLHLRRRGSAHNPSRPFNVLLRQEAKLGCFGERSMSTERYDNIVVERRGAIGIVTLNRPNALNALNAALIRVIAAENARFGQPEIQLGTMPGAGGTQRLPRFVGKAKAMDLCLTGRMMDAAEAERAGLVSRIVPPEKLMDEAVAVAERVAQMSRPIAMMVKESVNRAFETTLAEGVRFERRLFHSTFATEDQKEGMAAFVGKRKPAFKNR